MWTPRCQQPKITIKEYMRTYVRALNRVANSGSKTVTRPDQPILLTSAICSGD